jgi:hypothetical protein
VKAIKHRSGATKKSQAKRVVAEIAPGVRVMMDAYMKAYNEGSERVSSPLKYTDVINQALDMFLPSKPQSGVGHGEPENGGNDLDAEAPKRSGRKSSR